MLGNMGLNKMIKLYYGLVCSKEVLRWKLSHQNAWWCQQIIVYYFKMVQMFTEVAAFSNPWHVKGLLDTKKKCPKCQLWNLEAFWNGPHGGMYHPLDSCKSDFMYLHLVFLMSYCPARTTCLFVFHHISPVFGHFSIDLHSIRPSEGSCHSCQPYI